jgi:hypothetical protein
MSVPRDRVKVTVGPNYTYQTMASVNVLSGQHLPRPIWHAVEGPLSARYVCPVGSVLMRTSPPRAWASRIKGVERPPRLRPTLASQSPQRPACLRPRLVPNCTRRGVWISVDRRPSARESDAADRCCGGV